MREYMQLSLFDDLFSTEKVIAVNCFTSQQVQTEPVEDWMQRLVPDGDYAITVGGHPMVLRRLKAAKPKIPKGLEFCHYRISGVPYSGVFVG